MLKEIPFLNFFLINLILMVTIIFLIYKNKFSFNKFIFISYLYLPLILISFINIFFDNKTNFFFNLNIKFFFKPFFIEIFSIKISFLENYFIFTISLISFFANLLSFFYVNDDKKKKKFLIFLNFFSISMIYFVIQNCIFLFILSWELLGLTSFFLINHYENTKSYKSALSAFFFNRVSDMPIFIICFIMIINNNQNISINNLDLNSSNIVCFCLIISSFFKSAIVFFKWLPDSMEAPLPASALIHSATLVSAGIYLNIKYHYFLTNLEIMNFLKILTILIAIIFSIIAFSQTDIKKILAYSTIANCSFIYNLIFSKNIESALFYFSLHGIFKSLVFISFGYAIILYKHKQDLRSWNNLFDINNKISFLSIIPLACLASIQITPVYFYKSFFLNNFNSSSFFFLTNLLLYQIYSCSSFAYFLKIIKIIFLKKNNKKKTLKYINNNNNILNIFSLILYSFLSFIIIYLNKYNQIFFTNFNINYIIITYIIPFFYFNNLYLFNRFTIFTFFFFYIFVFFF